MRRKITPKPLKEGKTKGRAAKRLQLKSPLTSGATVNHYYKDRRDTPKGGKAAGRKNMDSKKGGQHQVFYLKVAQGKKPKKSQWERKMTYAWEWRNSQK